MVDCFIHANRHFDTKSPHKSHQQNLVLQNKSGHNGISVHLVLYFIDTQFKLFSEPFNIETIDTS